MLNSFLTPEQITGLSGMVMAEPPKDYRLPENFPDLSRAKRVSLDIEAYDPLIKVKGPGWRRKDAYIVGLGVATDDGFKEYFPFRHNVGPNLDKDKVFEWLSDWLTFYTGELLGANILYDFDGLQYENIIAPMAKFRDVQWDEALIDEAAFHYDLNTLAKKYLGETKVKEEIKALYGEKFIQRFQDIHPGHARGYVLGDVDLPLRVSDEQKKVLKKERLTSLSEMEHKLLPILLYLRRTGVQVDLDQADRNAKFFESITAKSLEKASYFSGVKLTTENFTQPSTLIKMFTDIGVTIPKTDKGNYSITDAWLKKQTHPAGKFLAAARRFRKAKSDFVDSFVLEHHVNSRLYPLFHPLRRVDEEDGDSTGTVSGRFSSTDPNLQQIPTRDKLIGPMCRAMFVADPGALMYASDYSQIEFRFIVHYAVLGKFEGAVAAQEMYVKDPKTDFHDMVVALTGLPRKYAKNINFGLAFCMGKAKLARELGLIDEHGRPTKKCLDIFKTYHEKVPFVKKLSEAASDEAERKGYMTTLLGRRSRFNLYEPREIDYSAENRPEALPYEEALKAYGKDIRRAMLHKALNRRIQGSAAELNKLALINIWNSGVLEKNDLTLSLTVHDEAVGSFVPSRKGRASLRELRHIMETSMTLLVPILTGCGIGKSWADAK